MIWSNLKELLLESFDPSSIFNVDSVLPHINKNIFFKIDQLVFLFMFTVVGNQTKTKEASPNQYLAVPNLNTKTKMVWKLVGHQTLLLFCLYDK
jgi:hypothetical protein